MRIEKIIDRLKAGERIMVTTDEEVVGGLRYSLVDGTPVLLRQFRKLRPSLTPLHDGLFPAMAQTFQWAE